MVDTVSRAKTYNSAHCELGKMLLGESDLRGTGPGNRIERNSFVRLAGILSAGPVGPTAFECEVSPFVRSEPAAMRHGAASPLASSQDGDSANGDPGGALAL